MNPLKDRDLTCDSHRGWPQGGVISPHCDSLHKPREQWHKPLKVKGLAWEKKCQQYKICVVIRGKRSLRTLAFLKKALRAKSINTCKLTLDKKDNIPSSALFLKSCVWNTVIRQILLKCWAADAPGSRPGCAEMHTHTHTHMHKDTQTYHVWYFKGQGLQNNMKDQIFKVATKLVFWNHYVWYKSYHSHTQTHALSLSLSLTHTHTHTLSHTHTHFVCQNQSEVPQHSRPLSHHGFSFRRVRL